MKKDQPRYPTLESTRHTGTGNSMYQMTHVTVHRHREDQSKMCHKVLLIPSARRDSNLIATFEVLGII